MKKIEVPIEREAVIESCVRLHCPMSDGDGVEIRVEELNEGPSVSFWKVSIPGDATGKPDMIDGGFNDVKCEYIATADDPVSAMEFLMLAVRMISLSAKRHAG